MTVGPIPEMTDEELDVYIAELLQEPAFRGLAAHHLQGILRANPDYPDLRRTDHEAMEARSREVAAALRPVLDELHASNVPADSVEYMRNIDLDAYTRAIPILVKWLPRTDHPRAKEWLARCLTMPIARPYIGELIAEFWRMRDQEPSEARWALGNAISIHIDARIADDVLELAADDRYKGNNAELIRSLWRLKGDDRVYPLLVRLLDAPHFNDIAALEALRKQADPRARQHLERYLNHPERWVREVAKKGIARIDRKLDREAGRVQPARARTKTTDTAAKDSRPWPSGLPHDALVSLMVAKLLQLESLSGMSRAELLAIPGVGSKTIERIQFELERSNLPPLTD